MTELAVKNPPAIPRIETALTQRGVELARKLIADLFRHESGDKQNVDELRTLAFNFARTVSRAQMLEDLSAREQVMRELAALPGGPELEVTRARVKEPSSSSHRADGDPLIFTPEEFVTIQPDQAVAVLLDEVRLDVNTVIDVFEAYERYEARTLLPSVARSVVRAVSAQVAIGLREGLTPRQFAARATELEEGFVSDKYAETVFRTERTSASAAGRVAQMFTPATDSFVIAIRYHAVGDADTRSNHLANHGHIWSKWHPVWSERMPANGFNCR